MKTNNKINEDYENAYNFLEFLIECFYKECINFNNKEFLKFIFSEQPKQKDLDDFLAKWDIESKGSDKVLFLANFMRENQNLEFNDYVKPRLEGLINYYRFKNIKKLEFISKVIKTLNKHLIELIALADLPAKEIINGIININNIELCINKINFSKISNILKASGYSCVINKKHKTVQITNDEDVSVLIEVYPDLDNNPKCSENFIKTLKESSVINNSFGKMQIPKIEHLVFIEMINLAKTIKFNFSFEKALLSIYKIKNFVNSKPDFDWNIVINDAKSTQTGVQLKLASIFLNKTIQQTNNQSINDFIPEMLNDNELFKQEIINYHYISIFKNFYNKEIRPKYKNNTFINLVKNIYQLIHDYVSIKFLYFSAKIMKRNPKMLSEYFKKKRKNNEIK